MDLPREVLLCLFTWLEPKDFGICGLICKSWFQMTQQNELWRHICFKKWENNPNNSNVPNYPLIPLLEGTNAIDWKMAYDLRRSTENVLAATLPKPPPHLPQIDYFQQSWITFEQFERIYKSPIPPVPQLIDFTMKFERVMLRQFDSAFLSQISFVAPFLAKHEQYLGRMPALLAFPNYFGIVKLVPADTIEYLKIARKRNILHDAIAENLRCRGRYLHYCLKLLKMEKDKNEYALAHAERFITTVISFIDEWVRSDMFENWVMTDSPNEKYPMTCFRCLKKQFKPPERDPLFGSMADLIPTLQMFAELSKPGWFMNLRDKIGGLSQVTRVYMTGAVVTEQFRIVLATTSIKELFDTYYPWLFQTAGNKPDVLVAVFETLKAVFEGLRQYIRVEQLKIYSDQKGCEDLYEKTLQYFKDLLALTKPILDALDVDNARVRFAVTRFIGEFRKIFNESLFEPVLTPFLDKLMPLLHDKTQFVRVKAMGTIRKLVVSSPGSISEHKSRLVNEFQRLILHGTARDREKAGLTVAQLCAAFDLQEFRDLFKPFYDDLIARLKNIPWAPEEQIVLITQYAILALKEDFKTSTYLQIVFPALQEHAMRDHDPKQGHLRKAAINGVIQLLQLDRDTLLPYYEQIGDIIAFERHIGSDPADLEACCRALEKYAKIFFTRETTKEMIWVSNLNRFAEFRLDPYALGLRTCCRDQSATPNQVANLLQIFTDIWSYLCTMNSWIRPLHSDQQLTVSAALLLTALHKSQQHRNEFNFLSSSILSFYKLFVEHSLNADTFFRVVWARIASGIFVLTRVSCEYEVLYMIQDVLERCGTRFKENRGLARRLLSAVWSCRDSASVPVKKIVATCTLLVATKHPFLLPDDLTETIAWYEISCASHCRYSEFFEPAIAALAAVLHRQQIKDENRGCADRSDITCLIDAAKARLKTLRFTQDAEILKNNIKLILTATLKQMAAEKEKSGPQKPK